MIVADVYQAGVLALTTTKDAAEQIIAATDFEQRHARDLRRALSHRRQLWL